MINIFRSPEIIRYIRCEAQPKRLLAGFLIANLVAGGMLLIATQTNDTGTILTRYIVMMQWALLIVYATIRATGSISSERADKTWDFQCLTPLSSWELAWGKLVGSPIFAYFLFAVLLPWAFLGAYLSVQLNELVLLKIYMRTVGMAFLVISAGLYVSSLNDRRLGIFTTLVGASFLLSASQFLPMFSQELSGESASKPTLHFYHMQFHPNNFIPISALVFGCWAMAGTKWRIGEDLSEPPEFWRLPIFIIFLYLYYFGFYQEMILSKEDLAGMLSLPVMIIYASALGSRFNADRMRSWKMSNSTREMINRAPAWLWGLMTLWCLSLITFLLCKFDFSDLKNANDWRMLFLIPIFATRDLAFLQWVRLGRPRRPEIIAMVYFGLAYILPIVVMHSFGCENGYEYLAPVISYSRSAGANILPGLAQAIAMCVILWTRVEEFLNHDEI